jgi:hypothetical protein
MVASCVVQEASRFSGGSRHSAYDQAQTFGGVIDVLEAVGATYAIWGGLAVVAYGEPRYTQDIDILLIPAGLLVGPGVHRGAAL